MDNLIQDTLNKIKEKHITPEPRWKFLLRKVGVWSLVSLIVFLGAASISVAYFLLSQLDWDLYRFNHQNALLHFFSIVPYFWIIFLIIFILGAFFGVRKTETGYRFNWAKIILVLAIGIIAIGYLMSLVGLDRRFNNAMMHGMPFYAQSIETKEKQWMQPEKGFLAGTIIVISKKEININDLNNKAWAIQLDSKTFVRPMVILEPRQMIKIIGTKKDGQVFEALEIRPWSGRGEIGGRQGRGMMR